MVKKIIKFGFIFMMSLATICSYTLVYAKASSDPIYDSMILPSESRSDIMISQNRNKAVLFKYTSTTPAERVISIGSLYRTSGESLPDTFSVYLGKIELFAFSKSQNKWISIDYQPYPTGVYTFSLPWETSVSKKCENTSYSDNYLKIDLTADEMNNSVLHFWGEQVYLNQEDYLYFACAYDFGVSPNAAGKLTAVNGIDYKSGPKYKTIFQLYASRGYSAESYSKTVWGHTVPVSEYDQYNTAILNQMYKHEPIETSSSNETLPSDTSLTTSSNSTEQVEPIKRSNDVKKAYRIV